MSLTGTDVLSAIPGNAIVGSKPPTFTELSALPVKFPETFPNKVPLKVAPANPNSLVEALTSTWVSNAVTFPACTPVVFPVTLPSRLPLKDTAYTSDHLNPAAPSV